MDMDLKRLIVEYYRSCKAMQIATVSNRHPWICTVYFVADDQLNLYWTSTRSRQHSIEIVENPETAVSIVKDIEHKQALQIIGESYEVEDAELQTVHSLYTSKFGPKDYDVSEIKKHNSDGRAYWKFKPNTISLWDEVNFPESPKQVYKLSNT